MPKSETYNPIYPHDSIEEIFSDVFMVRGCIRMNPFVRITRNMAVIRHGDELTLVDPIRLDAVNEEQLETMGEIKRILRLGPMHGADDRYYIDRFAAELWAPGHSKQYPDPAPDRILTTSSPLPFPDARLFCFEGTTQPESALLLERDGGLLLTCDSIQHYGDYRHNNWLARRLLPFIGFPKTTVLGPIWLKEMTSDGASLESEFRRLAGMKFAHLLSAHGSLLRDDAHASVERAIERAFPPKGP
jgi:hypothetical protein